MKNEFSQYQSIYWTVNYPSDWIVENNTECVSFYDEDGAGALLISSYSKDEDVIEEDLADLLLKKVGKAKI